MAVIGAISAFQEEGRISHAVTSLFAVGCDAVYVLDGAWLDGNGRPFGGGPYFSTDATCEEAIEAGATVGRSAIGPDADKQTRLLRTCGAGPGEFVVKIDADERLTGTLPPIEGDSLLWLVNHGANDIPGVRGTWPRGDDADHPIPLLRVFKWRPDLVCDRPGRWRTADGTIEPYVVGQLRQKIDGEGLSWEDPLSYEYRRLRDGEHKAHPAAAAAFPILGGVWVDHYRDGSRAAAKRAYYEAVA